MAVVISSAMSAAIAFAAAVSELPPTVDHTESRKIWRERDASGDHRHCENLSIRRRRGVDGVLLLKPRRSIGNGNGWFHVAELRRFQFLPKQTLQELNETAAVVAH